MVEAPQKPRKIARLLIKIVVALGISAVFAGVVAGRNTPDIYRNIPVPNLYLVALASLTLFFATLMAFITSEETTRRRTVVTLIAWAAFGVSWFLMLAWR